MNSCRGQAMKLKRNERLTMTEIVDQSRTQCSRSAWEKAKLASKLRKEAVAQDRSRAAAAFGKLKERHIRRAHDIAPAEIVITIDDDWQIGLLSVRPKFDDARLHLPAGTDLGLERAGAAPKPATAPTTNTAA